MFFLRSRLVLFVAVVLAAFPLAPRLAAAEADFAADRTRGILTGTVSDESTGLPLFGVEVSIEDQPYRGSSGIDGRFKIEDLPPGTHLVAFRLAQFSTLKVADVKIDGGATVALEVKMQPDDAQVTKMDEMVVTTESSKAGSRASVIEERRNIQVSMEVIGKEELGKLAVSDVAEAMVRLPGVSVASKGSFVVIRGLAERYNSATFNGIAIPSSDPERQSVELDQLPTRLIESLVVYKTFAPDLPGNLSGGGVDIRTLAFPTKPFLSITAGASVDDSRFHDGEYLTYPTSKDGDGWGKGAGGRLGYDTLLAFEKANPGKPFPPDANSPFTTSRHQMPFGKKFGAFYGRTFQVGEEGRLGVSLGLSYDSSFSTEEGRASELAATVKQLLGNDGKYRLQYSVLDRFGKPLPPEGYDFERGKEKVQIGALATVGYRFNSQHQVQFTAFSSQTGNDSAQYDFNFRRLLKAPFTQDALDLVSPKPDTVDVAERFRYQLHYRERNLTSLALNGSHGFPGWHDLRLTWSIARGSTYQDEPDRRKYTIFRPYHEVQFESAQISRIWRKVEETQDDYSVGLRLPFEIWGRREAKFDIGGALTRGDRTYTEGIPAVNAAGAVLENPQDISPYVFTIPDATPAQVDMKRELGALYTKVDVPVFEWMRLTTGVRWELTRFTGSGFGVFPTSPEISTVLLYMAGENIKYRFYQYPWDLSGLDSPKNRALASGNLKQWNALPAASLVFTPTSQFTIRLGYSHTVARPSAREMSNYISQDDQERDQHGNAFLRPSPVRNYDLRFEYFMEGTDLVAVTLFYKTIRNPIEKATVTAPIGEAPPIDMWFNNPGTAKVKGIEFEFRKGLGFFGDQLSAWSIGGNATRINAETPVMTWANAADPTDVLREKPLGFPEIRRLYDQPRWLLNADLTWDSKNWGTAATVSAFASDSLLQQVVLDGTNLDRYQAPCARWDFTLRQKIGKRWSVKLSGKNLTDPERRVVRDTSLLTDFTGELVDRRWHEGRSYTLTTTCEF